MEENKQEDAAKVLAIAQQAFKVSDAPILALETKSLAEIAPEGAEKHIKQELFRLRKEINESCPLFSIKWNAAGNPDNKDLLKCALEFYAKCRISGLEDLGKIELERFFSLYSCCEALVSIQGESESTIDFEKLAVALSSYIQMEPDTGVKLKCFVEKGHLPNPADDTPMKWIGAYKVDAGAFWKHLGWKRNNFQSAFSQPWEIRIQNADAQHVVMSNRISSILESFGIENKIKPRP